MINTEEWSSTDVDNKEAIIKLLTNDWITAAVKKQLAEKYNDSDINAALSGCSFRFISADESASHCKQPVFDPVFTSKQDYYEADMLPIIHQWLNNKTLSGELTFLDNYSTRSYSRFLTKEMDSIVPYQNNVQSGWKNGYFYSYEIVYKIDRVRMWIAFSNKNAPNHIREAFNRIMECTGKRPSKEDWLWLTIFSTPSFKCTKSTTQQELFNVLDVQFAQVQARVKEMLEIY